MRQSIWTCDGATCTTTIAGKTRDFLASGWQFRGGLQLCPICLFARAQDFKSPRRWKGDALDELVDLIQRGLTLRELGEHFGVTFQCIQQVVGRTPRAVVARRQYAENKRAQRAERAAEKAEQRQAQSPYGRVLTISRELGYVPSTTFFQAPPHRIGRVMAADLQRASQELALPRRFADAKAEKISATQAIKREEGVSPNPHNGY